MGAGGGTIGSGVFTSLLRKNWTVPTSCTTPNAKCPVCGAAVFYYQNSTGSKVFFDELGPPWPKHSCTADHRGVHVTRHSRDWTAGIIKHVSQQGTTSLRTILLDTKHGLKTLFINDSEGLFDVGLPAYLFEAGGQKLSAAVPLTHGVKIVSVKVFHRALEAIKCTTKPKQTEPKVPKQPWDESASKKTVSSATPTKFLPLPEPLPASEAQQDQTEALPYEARRFARLISAVADYFQVDPQDLIKLIAEEVPKL